MLSVLRLGSDGSYGKNRYWLAATANSLEAPLSDRLRHSRFFVIFKCVHIILPHFSIVNSFFEKIIFFYDDLQKNLEKVHDVRVPLEIGPSLCYNFTDS